MPGLEDGIERLECVYYAAPIPRDLPTLVILSLVFDKIHFPNVYLPKGDYDKEALAAEIRRLQQLPQNRDTAELIGMLSFLSYRLPFDGILEFPTPGEKIFGGGGDERGIQDRVRALYDAMYPPRPNWEPFFSSAHSKGLPNSNESVDWAGAFHYPVLAMQYASEQGIPLLNDEPRLPVLGDADCRFSATALSAVLALECVRLALPEVPVLTPRQLIEFRIENKKLLHAFRSSMLRYSRDVNDLLDDGSSDELWRKANFFLETEIKPTLHDLSSILNAPGRPWSKRAGDILKIAPQLAVTYLSLGGFGPTSASPVLDFLISELAARSDRDEAMKRSGLYYLLKLKAAVR